MAEPTEPGFDVHALDGEDKDSWGESSDVQAVAGTTHDHPLVPPVRIAQFRALAHWHRGLLGIRRNLSSGFRLGLGIRASLKDFRAQPLQLVALVFIAFATPLVLEFLQTDPPRGFLYWALMYHATVYFVLFGAVFCAAHWLRLPQLSRWITVALLAVSIWSGALFTLFSESLMQARYEERWVVLAFTYVAFGLWSLLYTARVLQTASGLTVRRLMMPLVTLALLSVGVRFVLPYSPFWYTQFDEAAAQYQPPPLADTEGIYYRQPQLLEHSVQALAPERPDAADLYFVGFGSYASLDVFMKETAFVQQRVENHFAQHGRAIRLINNSRTAHDTPVANVSNLAMVLGAIGQRMDVDNDVLFLYLTSHGSRGGVLSVEYHGLNPHQLDAQALRELLDKSAIRWRIVVVSACYSGSFIEALKNPQTLVLTAAHKDRTSFGCSNDRELTYFAEHLFQRELSAGGSLLDAFSRARSSLTARETREGHLASEPQLYLGDAMKDKLSALEAQAQDQD